MKNFTRVNAAPLVTFVFLIMGCSSNLTYQEAMDKNRKNIAEMSMLEDANFLVEAASYNLMEKELGELAKTRGYSSAVVEMARRNSEEHDDLGSDLNKLARKKKVKLPAALKSEHQLIVDRLAEAGRSDFDQEYVDVLEDINEDHTELFEDKSSQAKDADIRAFAARNLTLLRNHAEAISKVDEQLMHTQR